MVKVELQHDEAKGLITLSFETNKDDEVDVIDAVRVAVMSDLQKRFTYENSKKLVIQIKEDKPISK
jgi:hypothetical protein